MQSCSLTSFLSPFLRVICTFFIQLLIDIADDDDDDHDNHDHDGDDGDSKGFNGDGWLWWCAVRRLLVFDDGGDGKLW